MDKHCLFTGMKVKAQSWGNSLGVRIPAPMARETLLDAQICPEKHHDLIVRVAGYSAFFNVLSRATQDDIIARTEQAL